jgi:hypothetical protein
VPHTVLVVYEMQSLAHCCSDELHEHSACASQLTWSVRPLQGEVAHTAAVIGVASCHTHPDWPSHCAALLTPLHWLAKHMELVKSQ